MLFAGHIHQRSEDCCEHFEFALTQALSLRCRRADGTVMFDQEQIGIVDDHLGEVTLLGPALGNRMRTHRNLRSHFALVRRA